MFKSLVCLFQAAILVGMTGFAPYVAGHCALRPAAMPAMASMPGMDHGPADGGQAVQGGRAPSSAPHQHQNHHGCCGCMGPCASGGLLALPASAPVAGIGALRVAAAATTVEAHAGYPSPRLLPFANGPPHHLG